MGEFLNTLYLCAIYEVNFKQSVVISNKEILVSILPIG